MDRKKYTRFRYTEDQLELALSEIRDGKISQNSASIKYGIPKATLNNKIRGITPLIRKMGPKTILSEDEEKKLEHWILAKAKLGFPMHHNEVQEAVQSILKATKRDNPFTDDKPGKKWLKLFLDRRSTITKRNTEIISKARAAVTEESIRSWFSDLKQYLQNGGFEDIVNDPTRIFNADETGMQFCPKTGKLLGPKNYKDFYVISSGPEKESMTVLCNFSAAGVIVPPMLVVPYKRVPRDIAFSVPDTYFLGRSEKGWMVSETFYEYITSCFHPWLLQNEIKLPVILFLDGHKSHINVELFEFCTEKSILLYCLPPNATHIIQPCDVSIFKPLKTSWKKVIQDHKQSTNKYITKSTFAPLFKKAFENSVNKDIIQNGFRCCGLYPFDPNAINYGKTISARRKEIFEDEQSGDSEPTMDDFQATQRVLQYFFKDQYKDENSEIFSIYQLCKEKMKIADHENDVLTDSMIDAMPIQFDDITYLMDDQKDEIKPLLNEDVLIDLPNDCMDKEINQQDENTHSQTDSVSDELVIFCDSFNEENNPFANKHNKLENNQSRILSSAQSDGISDDSTEINSTKKNIQISILSDITLQEGSRENTYDPMQNFNSTNNDSINELENKRLSPDASTPTTTESFIDSPKLSKIDGKKKEASAVEDAWQSYLRWPKIADSKNNKKVKNAMPFALVSKEWKEYYDKKEKEKDMKLTIAKQNKENRKKKAEEKKSQKVSQSNKSRKKNDENNKNGNNDKSEPQEKSDMKNEDGSKKGRKKKDENNENENNDESELQEKPDMENEDRSKKRRGKNDENNENGKNDESELQEKSEDRDTEREKCDIGDFVVVRYDDEYFPGRIENRENEEFEVSTMTQSSCGKLWKWPTPADRIWYKNEDVLEKIPPPHKINERGFFAIKSVNNYL